MKTVEDVLAESVESSAIASPDSKPVFNTVQVAGKTCIEVDSNTYHRCNWGKQKFSRWKNYIEDEALRQYVQSHYNKSDELLIKDISSGAMVYFKRS